MLQYIGRNMKATRGASIKGTESDPEVLTVMSWDTVGYDSNAFKLYIVVEVMQHLEGTVTEPE
jgi:hypothetical protein